MSEVERAERAERGATVASCTRTFASARSAGRNTAFSAAGCALEPRLFLAVVVLAMALLPQAVDSLATVLVLRHLGWGAGSPIGYVIFEVDLLPLLLAAGLGIAAVVFRHGQRLTEDVAGLV